MPLISMRAAVQYEPGEPMTVREVQLREPEHGEVLVRTSSVGICGTDLHFASGRFPYPMPTILGHEASGIVEQVGEGVTTFQAGDRVLVCDQMPCGRCGSCLSGRMVYCSDASGKQRQRSRLQINGQPFRQYLGVSAFAEMMLVDATGLIQIPDDVSFEAAALLGCCLTTGAATVFNTANLRPGQTVLIIGCGGVGLGASQAAGIAGATRIIAADLEPHRRDAAMRLGATHTIDPANADLLPAILDAAGGQGVDIAIEAVGQPHLAETAFAALAPGGHAIVVGMMPPGGEIRLPAALLRHGRRMAGSVMGEVRSLQDIPAYIRMVISGRLVADDLATSRWPLERVNEAFGHASARRGIRTMIEL
ncbi:S-(hydroxymethyl)glutathione dehydrogenase / alcohol dehydrogenase [Sinosporangium album]|uniref:S-(Hydroxymethyl)glutathione dehydrogenase / alcohol dehydrogenase n=1 Tax=Sinosporangium album TaxID=504805 RepID=A0A1G8KXQ0_9ACTN|nr:zinc-binding dehydrogenase [Sinosporangium album]SDI48305.1 S-(hydroxymethyl)glutathione dehydrogenase / alcohol dehydrogenase [Sinosporangium album]